MPLLAQQARERMLLVVTHDLRDIEAVASCAWRMASSRASEVLSACTARAC